MSKVIGIDLGTTNSCVAVMEGGEPVVITNAEGTRTTPSVVAFSKNNERLVGAVAKRQAATNVDRTISSIKREMGTNYRVRIDRKEYSPQEISAFILMKLKKDAESYLGESVSQAVITVPAYFNDAQRQATKDAGRIAGLEVMRIINEPTSAALAYGLDHGQAQKIMVYDLGGGTFDVTVLEMFEGVLEVKASSGDNRLGGKDFDQSLVRWLTERFEEKNQVSLKGDIFAESRLKTAAEQCKVELSAQESAVVRVPVLAEKDGCPLGLEETVTRELFESLIAGDLTRTRRPVNVALSDSGLHEGDLDMVLLAGGSTRIPAVRREIRGLLGIEPSAAIHPDYSIAEGAAVQAGIIGGAVETEKSLVMTDVNPYTLGVRTTDEKGYDPYDPP